jgi:ribulose-5-phosphate 4-epimerase/fuculose-1-phosphate aldolase
MSFAWQEIARFGKKLVFSSLTSSRFGNISLLRDGRIFITCTEIIGVFAAGNSLSDAYTAACMAEHSAQLRYPVKANSRDKFISLPSLQ